MSSGTTALRLSALGDIMLDRDVGRHFREKPEDFRFDDISRILKSHDIVFANLENPVATGGVPHPIQVPHVTFRAHPDTLEILKRLGVTVVSIANNHLLDYGGEALSETLELLDNHNIKHVGAGRDYEEANRPLLFEANGIPIALLAYVFLYSASTKMAGRKSPGLPDHRIGKILSRIRSLKQEGYVVLVSLHWGVEYSFYPLRYQMQQARRMIDAGAKLIIGHGPHYPQGFEGYGSGGIVYSLGNFIFDEPYKFANRSFAYSVDLDEKGNPLKQRIYPVHLQNHVPVLVGGRPKERLEHLVRDLSKAYKSKDRCFWKKQNARYFSDIVNRIIRMKSLKFLSLPPLSFYADIGFSNLFSKIKFSNIKSIIRHITKGITEPSS